ncbi:MAG: hypothetical protein JSS07_12425 [Proteobacteria bacterium]|nr:hypothetical protein [Pseudomonadota bacterium]
MATNSDLELIVNYILTAWNDIFSDYQQAPLTLVYDPVSQFNSIIAGICHIAHNYMTFEKTNPDDQILIYNPEQFYSTSIQNLNDLPEVDCLILCSYQSVENIKFILSKLKSGGIAIILNEVYKIPDTDIPLIYKQYSNKSKDYHSLDISKVIQAYIKV